MKCGSLNLLEPLGPVQAYNRIALPLPIDTDKTVIAPPFIKMYRMIQKIHFKWQKLHMHVSTVVAFTRFKVRHPKITAFWDVKLSAVW
jgi:hypothetical protein